MQLLNFFAFTTVLASTISPTIQPSAIPPSAPSLAPRFYFGQSGDLGVNTTGSKVRDGTLAAFRQINDQGGVFGVLLDLVSYDDNGSAPITRINTQRFIDQKVIACMNYIGLEGITTSLPMLEAAGIPMITPATGARSLRLPVNRYILHTRASLDEEAHAWVSYCLSRGILTFAVYYQDDSDGVSGLEAILFALANQGLRPISIAKLVPGTNVSISGLLNSATPELTIKPQAIVILVPPDAAAAFIKLAKTQWPDCLFYATYTFGQDALVRSLITADVNQTVANDIYVTSVFPIPEPLSDLPPAFPNWQAAKSTLLRDYATALGVTCPGCKANLARLEGFLAGGLVASIMTHMLGFNYSSVLFRPYLDRMGVNASGGVALDDDASLRAWRELLIDTIYRESMFDVSGIKLGPYFENVTCNASVADCIQPNGIPCSQGMSHVYLTQPSLASETYVELPEWRVQSPSCNFHSLPPVTELPLLFGQSGLLSGAAGGYASDLRNGIMAAFAETNDSPSQGVRGRKLLLMTLDDNYTPQQALVNARHFIDNQSVVAVVGAFGDDPTEAVTPVYFNASLPLIGTTCGARFVRNSWVLAVRAFYDDEAAAMVNFARSRGFTKISIFRQWGAFGNSGLDAVNLALGYNKMSLYSEAGHVIRTLPVWPSVFGNLTKNGVPEVVILFVSIGNAGKFITYANDSTWANTIFIAASTSDLDRLPTYLSGQMLASGRVFGSAMVQPTRTGPFFQEYLSALKLIDRRLFKYGTPYAATLASLEGYMIGKLVISGLARVTEFTGTAMLADLLDTQGINISSVRLGPYTSQCNMGFRSTYIVRLENSTTSPLTQMSEYQASSSNSFMPNCGALSAFNTSFECPEGYDKHYLNGSTYDSVCKLCLSPYGCTLPEHVPNHSLRAAMLALNVIGFVAAVVFAVIVLKYRQTTTIRAASSPFCLLILIGAMLAYVFVFIQYPAIPTAATCMGQVYLLNTASCLLFGSLFAKVFRVTRIFTPRDGNSFRVLAIPNAALFGGVGAMWVIEMIYTGIWHATNPLLPVHASSPSEQYWVCQGEEPLWGIIDIIGNGLFLLYGVMLSVQSRRVPTLFNEAKFVAATMYNTFILGMISVLLGYEVASNDDQLYMYKSLGIFFVITVDLALLIASKFPSLYGEVTKGIIPQYKKDSSSNTSATSATKTVSPRKSEGNKSEGHSGAEPQSRGEAVSPRSGTEASLAAPAQASRHGGSIMSRIEAEVSKSRPVSKLEVEIPTLPAVSVTIDPPTTDASNPEERGI